MEDANLETTLAPYSEQNSRSDVGTLQSLETSADIPLFCLTMHSISPIPVIDAKAHRIAASVHRHLRLTGRRPPTGPEAPMCTS